MTVAYDAFSSNVGNFTSDISWTHTPSGTPKGALVLIFDYNWVAGGVITGITYGGVAMTQLALSPATYTMGSEVTARIFGYFLGSAIPTGAQTVAIDVDATGFDALAKAGSITVTAAADTTIEDTSSAEGTSATPSVALTVATESLCFGALVSGNDAVGSIAAGTGFTSVATYDLSSEVAMWTRANAVTSTDQSVLWTQTNQVYGAFGVAIKEVAAASSLQRRSTFSQLLAH